MSEMKQGPNVPPVPNIDEHPNFNEATAGDPEVQVGGNREDGPLTDEQKAAAEQGPQPAISITVVFMEDGQFGIQAQGEPNLGEMQMLLSRALVSIEARMTAETVTQVIKQNKSRIITPGQ